MYRRPEKAVGLAQSTQKSNQFVPKQLSKEVLTQWESTFNLVLLLLKSHSRQTLTEAFAKMKRQFQVKKKYGSFLGSKLHLLQRRKTREYLKWGLSCLQSNRISYYVSQREQAEKTKLNLRQRSAGLICAIYNKISISKKKQYLYELKNRSSIMAKATSFKAYHLANLLSVLFADKFRQSFVRIQLVGKQKISNLRRLGRVEKLVGLKRKQHLMHALIKLKINLIQTKAAALQEKEQEVKNQAQGEKRGAVQTKIPSQKNDRELQVEIRRLQTEQRTLNEKKKNLQRELAKLETQSQRSLQQFKKEVEKLEIQNSELVFNHDLLEQNNQELQKQLQLKQRGGRKKITKAQIWQNVYNNLLHFLSLHKDSTISKQQLLECLEMPLVPCNFNIQDLQQENQILSELLEEYKKNFPEPAENNPGGEMLPFDVIRKQNRYYYMVLQVLSEWGLPGSKELQQLNSDLAHIQKKLAS